MHYSPCSVMLYWLRGVAVSAAALLFLTSPSAQALPSDPAERECWLRSTFERTRVSRLEGTRVTFANLHNGITVDTPFRAEFSIKGMGIAPAGEQLPKTGHHHILIDTPLPVLPTEKIPFSDKHAHFGKGQTHTELDLPAGTHTLRLLFADHDHRPHFVYSSEITVHVRGRRQALVPTVDSADFDATCRTWYDHVQTVPKSRNQIYFVNLHDYEPVRSPFVMRFGVKGHSVSAKTAAKPDTGYFVLEVQSQGRTVRSFELDNGATEAELNLPAGLYAMRLRFLDRTGRDILPSVQIQVPVS